MGFNSACKELTSNLGKRKSSTWYSGSFTALGRASVNHR